MKFGAAEVNNILARFNTESPVQLRNYCILQLMVNQGLSVEEVLALSVEDVCFANQASEQLDLDDGMIIVSGELEELLQQWLQIRPSQAETLFCTLKTAKTITKQYLSHIFRQAVIGAGLDPALDLAEWHKYGQNQGDQMDEEKSVYSAEKGNSKRERRKDALEYLQQRWREIARTRKKERS